MMVGKGPAKRALGRRWNHSGALATAIPEDREPDLIGVETRAHAKDDKTVAPIHRMSSRTLKMVDDVLGGRCEGVSGMNADSGTSGKGDVKRSDNAERNANLQERNKATIACVSLRMSAGKGWLIRAVFSGYPIVSF